MADRERKRARRRKRKEQAAERRTSTTERRDRISARVEERNREARERLQPLPAGERPTIVTLAAVISGLVALASLAGYLAWDALRDDPRPQLVGVVSFIAVVGIMAWGLWRTRYWAVLGFQSLLAIVMVIAALGAVGSVTVGLAFGNVVLLAGAGVLFYFMVKAMARIQMPRYGPPE